MTFNITQFLTPIMKQTIAMCNEDKREYIISNGKVLSARSRTELTPAVIRAIRRAEKVNW